VALAASLFVVLAVAPAPRAQSVPAVDRRITYVLPQWPAFITATQAQVNQEVEQLRSKVGEGLRVKVGFTTYIVIEMTPVSPSDTAAIQVALQPALAQMDGAIAKAVQAGIPICFSFLTAIRQWTDPAQTAARAEDVRSVQWYSDNTIATNWITHSRYARKFKALEEAFIREMGRQLAARMLLHPGTIVAASGDGEVELSSDKSSIVPTSGYSDETSLLADYSPFAVAEFRDWLRQGGLYAPGQPFAGQAWVSSARYAGDASPDEDSNGDGHSLNADFNTSFETWNLEHFDWSLADSPAADPHAIPESTYNAPGFNRLPGQPQSGFDAPRVRVPSNSYWALWNLFRQTMVQRHNQSFAKWMTTSADPATGATVPADRWFSDQIVADYLFTNVIIDPADLTGFAVAPTFRLDTSASPLFTADIRPYGSIGITAFNLNAGLHPQNPSFGTVYYRTLAAVGPAISALRTRWGIFEWHPSAGGSTGDAVYDLEMDLAEKHRPSILVPFLWGEVSAGTPGLGPRFEAALRKFVTRRNNVPLTLSRTSVFATTLTNGTARSNPQVIRVSGEPGDAPSFTATSASEFVEIAMAADGRSFTVGLKAQPYPALVQSATIIVTPGPGQGYTASNLTLQVTANLPGTTAAPFGSFDTPADLQVVTGEVGITGWAVDDVGVAKVDIYRSPLTGEPTQPNGLVFLGTASPVEGARPDVESVHGTIPGSSQAGWGYMLLSNFLPNAGNGVFTIHAIVTDLDGHAASLGTRRIDCRNGAATTPFGTIDTPLQGQTVSGTIVNFGWALTPLPNTIPADGSTIDVIIDGVPVGHPTYGNPRADIAGLFPGLNNTAGPVGYFYIDTTTLTNGVHTIAWVVRDNSGAATGMGSRFFTVANP